MEAVLVVYVHVATLHGLPIRAHPYVHPLIRVYPILANTVVHARMLSQIRHVSTSVNVDVVGKDPTVASETALQNAVPVMNALLTSAPVMHLHQVHPTQQLSRRAPV
jgi:hypothetical protein